MASTMTCQAASASMPVSQSQFGVGDFLQVALVDDGHAGGEAALGLDLHVREPPREQVRMGERHARRTGRAPARRRCGGGATGRCR